MTAWIDELERDLGLAVRLRLIASVGGQRRDIPHPFNAKDTALAVEIGSDAVRWLGERFAGTQIDFPSARGSEREQRANLLRAAVLEAGLTKPTRSANDLARDHGVSADWVKKLRSSMRAEARADICSEPDDRQLSLF